MYASILSFPQAMTYSVGLGLVLFGVDEGGYAERKEESMVYRLYVEQPNFKRKLGTGYCS